MSAAHNFTERRWLFAFGLTGAAVAFLSGLLRALPSEIFPSFALFFCFLAAMAGASSRTMWAGIAQGSAYALLLRCLIGTQFGISVVTPSQSLFCVLPLLAAFGAFLLFHRLANSFYDRQKYAAKLLSRCRTFCLVIACLDAALSSTILRGADTPPAPNASTFNIFTSSEPYSTLEFFKNQKALSRTDTSVQFVSVDRVAGSETLNASDATGSGISANLDGLLQTPLDNPTRHSLSFHH